MYYPDFDTFCKKAEEGNLVPVYRELPADLETPASAFLKLHTDQPAFFLESVEKGERVGRYSFLATSPYWVLSSRGDRATLWQNDNQDEIDLGERDVLHLLEQMLAGYKAVKCEGLPPFVGGAVGFLSYDMVRFFERLPEAAHDELNLPDCAFLFADTIVIFDHLRHTMKIVSNAHVTWDVAKAYEEAIARIDAIVEILEGPPPHIEKPKTSLADSQLTSNFTLEEFCQKVEAAKEYIAAGDAFQIVLSQRLRRKTTADSFAIYRALRRLNPSPYMFYLDLGSYQLIGSSPEMLVKLEGSRACIRPLAGTRRRGENEAEDSALAAELLADEKERAEHVMLVDLARNDLGRICKPGTVKVPILMDVEKYSHVMHIVSEVEGEIRDDRTPSTGYSRCRTPMISPSGVTAETSNTSGKGPWTMRE
ncbi:MAG: chorismate-binding protein [Chloroflexi bacterium]|nr:chorismate-binding protein [Chloroflexota bacterium]